jgi:hypothetical protein
MITAIVRYKLPATIGKMECREHFLKIAKGHGEAKGLVRKQFIWNESGTAGGTYQWETIDDAETFYQGPWLAGILSGYSSCPDFEYFTTVAMTEKPWRSGKGAVVALLSERPVRFAKSLAI